MSVHPSSPPHFCGHFTVQLDLGGEAEFESKLNHAKLCTLSQTKPNQHKALHYAIKSI